MIKYIYLLAVILFVFSCKNGKKDEGTEAIRVSILKGPSAIAFAQWLEKAPVINGRNVSIRLIDSPDIIQAQLIKKETDIAVLPMLSAANLYNKGIHYALLGCPLWGTLYLIERKDSGNTGQIHLFGAGTTPDILSRHYMDSHKLNYTLNYTFGTAREMMQALLAHKVNRAVLSEPFVSMALRKDSTLHILADLNNPEDMSTPGFPQTAIVYTPSLSKEIPAIDSLLRASCRFAVEHPDETIRIMEQQSIFPKGMLTTESVERCRINYLTAAEANGSIRSFFQLVEQYEPKAIGGKLPDAGFIPER